MEYWKRTKEDNIRLHRKRGTKMYQFSCELFSGVHPRCYCADFRLRGSSRDRNTRKPDSFHREIDSRQPTDLRELIYTARTGGPLRSEMPMFGLSSTGSPRLVEGGGHLHINTYITHATSTSSQKATLPPAYHTLHPTRANNKSTAAVVPLPDD